MANPKPAVPQVPKKTLQMNKWLVGAMELFAIGCPAIGLIHLPGPGANEKPPAQPFTPPSLQTDVRGFDQARKQKFDDIAKKRDLLANEIKNTRLGDEEALIGIVNHLPPCSKAQRDRLDGQNFDAVNQQSGIVQFAYESDDSWHPLPAAAALLGLHLSSNGRLIRSRSNARPAKSRVQKSGRRTLSPRL